MVLACHMMSYDQATKGSCDFMGSSPSCLAGWEVSSHPVKFGGHSHQVWRSVSSTY